MKRKIVGLLLSIVLVVGLMPTVGFAADDGTSNDDRAVQTQQASDGQEAADASLSESNTVKFAMPKELINGSNSNKDSNKISYVQLLQKNQNGATTMTSTKKDITIGGTVYTIYSATTTDKPTKELTSFRVCIDIGSGLNNQITSQWYSDGEFQYGENIVAVPLDWETKMIDGSTGTVTYADATEYTATFDLNGGSLRSEQITKLRDKNWNDDSTTNTWKKQFVNGTTYSTIIEEWDDYSPSKTDDVFEKWIPESGTLKANQTFTAQWEFSKTTPIASDFTFKAPSNLTYDGAAKSATVTVNEGITGMGEVTVKYFDVNDNQLTSAPTNAGTYTVKIDVADGTSYATVENLTDASWTFVIAKATPTASFESATVSKTLGDLPFTNAFTTNSDGTKSFTSSDQDVATVNPTTGEVTVVGYGSATITVNVAEATNYTATSASYTLAVRDPGVSYSTHVENIGWQDAVSDGQVAGTQGLSNRLEALKIELICGSGNIEYRTHVQNEGWEETYAANGEISGTEGKALRTEAIQIKLTGDIANTYDVYYRVHVQNIGWMNWAKNGEQAGSEGYAYRLEGMQVVLVEKDAPAPGTTYAGITSDVEYAFLGQYE